MNKKITFVVGSSLMAVAAITLPIATTTYAATSTSTINGMVNSTITVTSAGPVSISTAPTSVAVTSSARDTVNVSTNNESGYSLTLETNSADRNLTHSSDSIAASAGTLSAPVALADNTWGYRVDGVGGFSGTTVAETNLTSSAFTWAGVPAAGNGDTIKTTTTTASNDQTDVWYAMSADTSKPSGTYSNTVVYTATAQP